MAQKEIPTSSLKRFPSVFHTDAFRLPVGKHKQVILDLVNELELLESGKALKVPLVALPDTKENFRSALGRATWRRGMSVEVSSDSDHLYVWRTEQT